MRTVVHISDVHFGRTDDAVDLDMMTLAHDHEVITGRHQQLGHVVGVAHKRAGGFGQLQAPVGGALAGAPGPTVGSLGWRDRSLELQMLAPNTDALTRFAQALNARGLTADVASATPLEKGVQAQVRIAVGPPT